MKQPFDQAIDFSQNLRTELLTRLPSTFKALGKKLAVRRKRADGHDIVMLWSRPAERVDDGEFVFSFMPGRSFDVAAHVEKRMGTTGTLAQIQQFSERLVGLGDIPLNQPFEWSANVYEAPTVTAQAMAEAIPLIAEPFWQRFSAPLSARDALVSEDPWCAGGHLRWANVLVLDIALGDVERFRTWIAPLDDPIKQQAEYLIELHERANSDSA